MWHVHNSLDHRVGSFRYTCMISWVKVFSLLTEFSHSSSNFLYQFCYRNTFSVSVQLRSFIVTFTLDYIPIFVSQCKSVKRIHQSSPAGQCLIFTWGKFWPPGIVVACICVSVCVSVNYEFARVMIPHPFKLRSANWTRSAKHLG